LPCDPAYHIDATGTSARRPCTNVGITLGALIYPEQQHAHSEIKLMTLAVGQVKHNAPSLRTMLGDKIGSVIRDKILHLREVGDK